MMKHRKPPDPDATDDTPRNPRKPVSRMDLLAAKIVALIMAVGAPLLILQNRIRAWAVGEPLTWHSNSSQGPTFDKAETLTNVSVHYSGELIWQQSHADVQLWLVALIPDVLTAGICATIGALVFRLLRRVEKGRPFLGASVTHVRTIGILTLCYGVIMPLVIIAVGTVLTFQAQAEPAYGFHIDAKFFIAAAAGIVILVLSEAWRHGQRMDDDLTGLV